MVSSEEEAMDRLLSMGPGSSSNASKPAATGGGKKNVPQGIAGIVKSGKCPAPFFFSLACLLPGCLAVCQQARVCLTVLADIFVYLVRLFRTYMC